MAVNPKSLKNLGTYRARDTHGNSKQVGVSFTPELIEEIAKLPELPGGRSEHIRRAVQLYLAVGVELFEELERLDQGVSANAGRAAQEYLERLKADETL